MGETSTYPPIRGRAYDLWFTIPANDGTTILSPTGLTATATADGRTYPVRSVRLMDANTGACLASLDELTMSATNILFRATSTSTGALPYEERLATAKQNMDAIASRSRRRKEWAWR